MKFTIIFILILLGSCISQRVSQKRTLSLKTLFQSGEPIYVENETFDEEINLTTWSSPQMISQGIYQVQIMVPITFVNCTFQKSLSAFSQTPDSIVRTHFMSAVSFINCRFEDEVSFRAASVQGRADFSQSVFNGKTSFEEGSFHENAYFSQCDFEEELRFHNSFFHQKANFMKANFSGVTSFQQSVFNAEAQFNVCTFYQYADFTLLDSRAKLFFHYTRFKDQAHFSHARFRHEVHFQHSGHKNSYFDQCHFMAEIHLQKIKVQDEINFEDTYFLKGTPNLDDIPGEKVAMEL